MTSYLLKLTIAFYQCIFLHNQKARAKIWKSPDKISFFAWNKPNFILFKGLSVVRDCPRPDSKTLNERVLFLPALATKLRMITELVKHNSNLNFFLIAKQKHFYPVFIQITGFLLKFGLHTLLVQMLVWFKIELLKA